LLAFIQILSLSSLHHAAIGSAAGSLLQNQMRALAQEASRWF
jgi:hypothetical protein